MPTAALAAVIDRRYLQSPPIRPRVDTSIRPHVHYVHTPIMRHAYMYSSAYESNYTNLKPGAKTYVGTDGTERPVAWPDKIDGVRVSYMEKSGKKFYAVRVQYGDHDVVLENPVHID